MPVDLRNFGQKFGDISVDGLSLPAGAQIDEDGGDLVVRDSGGSIVLRRDETAGAWDFVSGDMTGIASLEAESVNGDTIESSNASHKYVDPSILDDFTHQTTAGYESASNVIFNTSLPNLSGEVALDAADNDGAEIFTGIRIYRGYKYRFYQYNGSEGARVSYTFSSDPDTYNTGYFFRSSNSMSSSRRITRNDDGDRVTLASSNEAENPSGWHIVEFEFPWDGDLIMRTMDLDGTVTVTDNGGNDQTYLGPLYLRLLISREEAAVSHIERRDL